MIKIIKQGTRKVLTCGTCGCIFSYEKEDVKPVLDSSYEEPNCVIETGEYYVACPQCIDKIEIKATR